MQEIIIKRLQNRNILFEDKAFDEKTAKAFCHLFQIVTIKGVWYYPLSRNFKGLLCR
jgi:hypothetical protein